MKWVIVFPVTCIRVKTYSSEEEFFDVTHLLPPNISHLKKKKSNEEITISTKRGKNIRKNCKKAQIKKEASEVRIKDEEPEVKEEEEEEEDEEEEFKEFNFVRDYDAEELAPASAPVRRKSARNKGIPENEE